MRRSSGISRRGRAALTVGVLAVLVGGVLGGCTSPRNALGASSSPCFRALPTAHAAVHGHGQLLGVQYLTIGSIDKGLKHTDQFVALLDSLAPAGNEVCLVGYQNDYLASAVEHPWPPGRLQAKYALVLVDLHGERVLATLLLERAPIRLSRI